MNTGTVDFLNGYIHKYMTTPLAYWGRMNFEGLKVNKATFGKLMYYAFLDARLEITAHKETYKSGLETLSLLVAHIGNS